MEFQENYQKSALFKPMSYVICTTKIG